MAKNQKTLSFGSVLLLGINGIIGSGIFLLPGTLFKEAGWNSLTTILIACLATTLIAMNYAVMASKMDENGGAWIYADRAFGHLAGFQIGWFSWFLGVITISTEIAAFLTTLSGFWPAAHHKSVYITIALCILLSLLVINMFGPGMMKVIDNLSSAIKILLLLTFIIGSAIFIFERHSSLPAITGTGDGHVMSAFTTSFYMFTGFSFLPIAAKQMKNVEKTLPRALLIVMVIVSAIYLLAQLFTIKILGQSLVNDRLPVASAFAQVLGPIGRSIILAGMLASTLGVAVAVSFDTPVGLASLATEKQLLPREFGKKNRFGAPVLGVLATIVLAAVLVVSGSYLFLVNLIVFSSFVQYISTVAALIRLRHDNSLPQGMRLPGGLIIPIISLLIIGYLMTKFSVETYSIGIGFAILGELIYVLDDRKKVTD